MGMEIIISVMLLLVGIAVLVVIHVCIVSRAFGGSRNDPNGEDGVTISVVNTTIIRTSTSISRDDIKKLPSFHYMVEDAEDEDVHGGGGGGGNQNISSTEERDCAVCLENFRVGEECRLLPKCKHCFHAACIDSWLLKAAVCPICRTEAISQTLGGSDGRNQIQVLELV